MIMLNAGREGCVLVRLRLFQGRPARKFRDTAVLDVDRHAIFVHPPFTCFRVVVKVRWVLLPWKCGFENPVVGPKLVAGIG